eukprot:9988036-Alexandrium_andersonii.AAC.1
MESAWVDPTGSSREQRSGGWCRPLGGPHRVRVSPNSNEGGGLLRLWTLHGWLASCVLGGRSRPWAATPGRIGEASNPGPDAC